MDKNQIQPILQEALEEKIPSSEITLWNVVKNRLVTYKKITLRTRRVLRAAFATILVAVLVLFITSQGRAWAQTLLRFFDRGNGMPAPVAGEVLPTRTPQPTYQAELVTVAPGETDSGSFLTPPRGTTGEVGDVVYNLTLEDAQKLAGFDIRVPVAAPAGYQLSEISFDKQTYTVWQIYKFQPYQSGEMFIISQSRENAPITIEQDATVEQIQVGDVPVEHVTGMWFAEQGAAWETWDPNVPLQTFRWEDDGFYFTLQFVLGETFSPAYLSQQDMITEIEVLMGLQTSWPDTVNLNYLTSYEAVEEAAGFDIITPSMLPEGFVFSHGVYEPGNQRVVLIYRPEDGSRYSSGTSLVIFEIPGATPAVSWDDFPAGAVETVSIGATTGTFVRGAIVDGVYDPGFGLSVLWETGGLHIQVRFAGGDSPAQLDEAAILEIARSMK
jgi:hypothetical protein